MARNETLDALEMLLNDGVAELLTVKAAAWNRPTAAEWSTGYCKGVAAAIAVVRRTSPNEVFDGALVAAAEMQLP